MPQQFITTLRRTVEEHVRVTVPDGTETERDAGGGVYVKTSNPNISLSLEVAAMRGLVTVERL